MQNPYNLKLEVKKIELAFEHLMNPNEYVKTPEELKDVSLQEWTLLGVMLDNLLEEQSQSELH
jgi:hypothetical protein